MAAGTSGSGSGRTPARTFTGSPGISLPGAPAAAQQPDPLLPGLGFLAVPMNLRRVPTVEPPGQLSAHRHQRPIQGVQLEGGKVLAPAKGRPGIVLGSGVLLVPCATAQAPAVPGKGPARGRGPGEMTQLPDRKPRSPAGHRFLGSRSLQRDRLPGEIAPVPAQRPGGLGGTGITPPVRNAIPLLVSDRIHAQEPRGRAPIRKRRLDRSRSPHLRGGRLALREKRGGKILAGTTRASPDRLPTWIRAPGMGLTAADPYSGFRSSYQY